MLALQKPKSSPPARPPPPRLLSSPSTPPQRPPSISRTNAQPQAAVRKKTAQTPPPKRPSSSPKIGNPRENRSTLNPTVSLPLSPPSSSSSSNPLATHRAAAINRAHSPVQKRPNPVQKRTDGDSSSPQLSTVSKVPNSSPSIAKRISELTQSLDLSTTPQTTSPNLSLNRINPSPSKRTDAIVKPYLTPPPPRPKVTPRVKRATPPSRPANPPTRSDYSNIDPAQTRLVAPPRGQQAREGFVSRTMPKQESLFRPPPVKVVLTRNTCPRSFKTNKVTVDYSEIYSCPSDSGYVETGVIGSNDRMIEWYGSSDDVVPASIGDNNVYSVPNSSTPFDRRVSDGSSDYVALTKSYTEQVYDMPIKSSSTSDLHKSNNVEMLEWYASSDDVVAPKFSSSVHDIPDILEEKSPPPAADDTYAVPGHSHVDFQPYVLSEGGYVALKPSLQEEESVYTIPTSPTKLSSSNDSLLQSSSAPALTEYMNMQSVGQSDSQYRDFLSSNISELAIADDETVYANVS